MQSLIATTFEVVHYVALQAVHYKPLQEVHLSRYNQINGEYFDCRYFKSPYEFHFTKSLTPISWNHIESIEFRFATIPANINFYGDYIPVSLASKFELCLCVTAKNGDEVWTGINLTCWPLGGNSYLSEIRNIERAVYRFTGRTDLTVNRIRYSDMCYCLVPLASFQPYKK